MFAKLGPEPLESGFTSKWLFENLGKRKRQLKPLLLDQAFIAGLGNIYTDECLHMAKLHPLAVSNDVTQKQSEALREAIRSVLREGIRRNGASIDWVYRGAIIKITFACMTAQASPVLSAVQKYKTYSGSARYACLSKCQRLVIPCQKDLSYPNSYFAWRIDPGWAIGF